MHACVRACVRLFALLWGEVSCRKVLHVGHYLLKYENISCVICVKGMLNLSEARNGRGVCYMLGWCEIVTGLH